MNPVAEARRLLREAEEAAAREHPELWMFRQHARWAWRQVPVTDPAITELTLRYAGLYRCKPEDFT